MEDHPRPHELSFSWDRRGYSARSFSARTATSWTSIVDASLARHPVAPRRTTALGHGRAARKAPRTPRTAERPYAPQPCRAPSPPGGRNDGGASAAAASIPAAFRRRSAAPHYNGLGAGVVIQTAILAEGLASGNIWRRSSRTPSTARRLSRRHQPPAVPDGVQRITSLLRRRGTNG
jgi:hypothetical protein